MFFKDRTLLIMKYLIALLACSAISASAATNCNAAAVPPVVPPAASTAGVVRVGGLPHAPDALPVKEIVPLTQDLLKEMAGLTNADQFAQARDKGLAALEISAADDSLRPALEEALGTIAMDLIRTPRMMPEKAAYIVKSGDSVARIAALHETTVELILESNQIARPNLIKAGDRLRVLKAPFTLTVSKTRNDLVLKLDGRFCKRYRVGTGKFGRTPTGVFAISEKVKEPPWSRPDGKLVPFGEKENILGTRWLSLKAVPPTEEVGGYGIHGTWDQATLGKAESSGCVRLKNSDVEELFTILPYGVRVVIEE